MKKTLGIAGNTLKIVLSLITIVLISTLAVNRGNNTKIFTNDTIDNLLSESTEVTPAEFNESTYNTYTRTTINSDEDLYIYRLDTKETKQMTLNRPMHKDGNPLFSVRSKANNRARYYFEDGGNFSFEGIEYNLRRIRPAIMNDNVKYEKKDLHVIKNGDTVILHRNAQGAITYIVDGNK